jgi:NAD(P)-dependent dehydrogenase (short-subunit alcohol dehydrogenase family)
MRLAGKTALIVGGTTGIGFAAARLMIAEGAQVAICGQEPERLREASTALGERAKTYRADLRSISDASVGRPQHPGGQNRWRRAPLGWCGHIRP